MKNTTKEMTDSKKNDLGDVSTRELIQNCDKGKLYWYIKKRVNHKDMPEWTSCGHLLADLQHEVEASLSKGVDVDKTISKHEHTNPYAYTLEFRCQSHVSLSFMNEKPTKHHRNVLVTGLSVDFKSILWKNKLWKSWPERARPAHTDLSFTFNTPRRVRVPLERKVRVKRLRVTRSRIRVKGQHRSWITKIEPILEFSKTMCRKQENVNSTRIDKTNSDEEGEKNTSLDELLERAQELVSADASDEGTLRRLRARLLAKARVELPKLLHGSCGKRRHLSEVEMCGKEETKLEDRRGRSLRHVFGSKTCPRDVKVLMLIPHSQREEYRKRLKGSRERFVRVGADDAGERTCWSVFDLWNGVVFFIGDSYTRQYLRKIYIPSAKLLSKLSNKTITDTERQKLEFKLSALRSTFARRQRALRKMTVNFITQMFDVFVKPKFEISRMTRKSRRLSAEITARMLSIGHGKFIEELRRVCKERSVILDESTDERHSSKCCGKCSKIHSSLGGSKIFVCKHCDNVEERGTYTVCVCRSRNISYVFK